MPDYDVIFVGIGLANALIALRLQQTHPQLKLLLVEGAEQVAGNHTWSFHRDDLSEQQLAWLQPFICYQWAGYHVRFPQRQRTLPGEYFTITSERLAECVQQQFSQQLLTDCPVSRLAAEEVILQDGRKLSAKAVIDGRGFQADPALVTGFQAFVGQVWELDQPHGLQQPIIMDATVDQQQGYRFVYTLPLSSHQLLIEDTHYIDQAWLKPEQARINIRHYAQQQGWQLSALLREEQGALPITLAGDLQAFWGQRSLPCSGLRAGLFHATTGYSLPHAVALADLIAQLPALTSNSLHQAITAFAQRSWAKQRFFRILNRMLFLAGPAEQRWAVMQRFYGLNAGLIARFYAGQLTPLDKLRILSGKPPVPVLAAIKAICRPLTRRVKK